MCDDGHAIQSIYSSLSLRQLLCMAVHWYISSVFVRLFIHYITNSGVFLLVKWFKCLCHDLAAIQHCCNMCRIFHSKIAFLSMLLGHRSLVTFPVVEFVLSESSLGMPSCVELIIVNILRLKLLVLFLR